MAKMCTRCHSVFRDDHVCPTAEERGPETEAAELRGQVTRLRADLDRALRALHVLARQEVRRCGATIDHLGRIHWLEWYGRIDGGEGKHEDACRAALAAVCEGVDLEYLECLR